MFKEIFKGIPIISNAYRQSGGYYEGEKSGGDFYKYLERETDKFLKSRKRRDMLTGERYYNGIHDIINRKRTAIGQRGEIIEISNLPNNIIIDNQYARMADQKNSYLLSKELTFTSSDKKFLKKAGQVLGLRFGKTLRDVGLDCINCGVGYIYIYIDEGELKFKRLIPYEMIPFWKDDERTQIDYALRIYDKRVYKKGILSTESKAELFLPEGIKRFFIKNGKFIPEKNGVIPYLQLGEETADFGKVPIIPFRQNEKEIPLIMRVKNLQDALNTILSDYMNNLQEDARNTILVLKNYDGTNLGEFRKNLAEFGAVKVKSTEGADGGVSTLKIEVNSENFKTAAECLKRAIVENSRGIDSKSDKMIGNLSRMNIQSIYSDTDLDANIMESEFKASFEGIFFFVRFYLENLLKKNFDGTDIKVIFNRDILINETEAIENCIKSLSILSKETVISQHPWISDVSEEIKKSAENINQVRSEQS